MASFTTPVVPMDPLASDHVLGFSMTVVAGMATVLGAAFIPFLKSMPNIEGRLASGSLGFAAGVMLYVSFVDVLGEEAKEKFEEHVSNNAYETTLRRLEEDEEPKSQLVRIMIAAFFFVGIALGMALHWFTGDDPQGCEEDTRGARAFEMAQDPKASELSGGSADRAAGRPNLVRDDGQGSLQRASSSSSRSIGALQRVSLVAFVALTIHNVPEGLATFFAGGQKNWSVPFAIALHNIPEGAAIAIPHCQVTGSLREAIQRCLLAGMAQPAGAALGWLLIIILQLKDLPEFLYGAIYAMTAGVMVSVSIIELIPEALRDTSPFFVGCCVFAGFLLMEISIVCLGLSGA